jgi:aminopeptidase N
MKKTLLPFLIFLLTVGSLNAQQSTTNKGSAMCAERKMQNSKLVEKSFRSVNAPKHSFDVLKYTITLDIVNCFQSPYPHNFKADVNILFLVDSTLSQIALNADNYSLTIDSVKLNGVSFTHASNKLTIQLDRTYNPGEQAEVHIYYTHKNVTDGAFYASGGFVFTDCEPEGARKWFPCYDSPSDKALTDITSTVPVDAKLGSNGKLQDSLIIGNALKYHWVSRDPVATYLTVLSARTNYNLDIVNWTNPNTSEVIPMRFYFNEGENPSYIESIIGDMTTFYSSEFGDEPFEKNGFATMSNEFAWGGMENQTLTSLCPDCWSESLVAHEYAHQWFGDMITCATWADIFLNEGFATWTEAHWLENTDGYEAYKNELYGYASYYLSANPGWAISVPEWAINTPDVNTLFNYAITYMKGSCVLHMLRYTLGDSVFFPAMKAYATDTVDFKYKSATIEDFKTKMEAESGRDLGWFFDEWIYKPNHPIYQNVYGIYNNNNKWQINFVAKQTVQQFIPYFQMPIELLITFKDGTDSLVKVFNSFNGENFAFEFDKEPSMVTFDPNNEILLKQGNTVVGLNDEITSLSDFSLKASPNPLETQTQISYNLETPAYITIELYNNTGVKLRTIQDKFLTSGKYSDQLKMENLERGMYFVVFRSANKIETLKIVKSE